MVNSKNKQARRTRKEFRLPSELAAWASDYAQTKNKTLTQLVVDLLTDLQERSRA